MDSTVDSTGTRLGLDWDSTVSRCGVAPSIIVRLQCGSSLPAFQAQLVACAVLCLFLGPHVLASQEPPAHREASSASASTPGGISPAAKEAPAHDKDSRFADSNAGAMGNAR